MYNSVLVIMMMHPFYIDILQENNNSCLSHQFYFRIEFGRDGYLFTTGLTNDYWTKFEKEKRTKKGKLVISAPCLFNVDRLLELVESHPKKYKIKENNCQHFALLIYHQMTTRETIKNYTQN